MEIIKCVGSCFGKRHKKKGIGFLLLKHTLSYLITDNADYLVDLVLGNTWSCKSSNKDRENKAFS